MLAIMMIIKNNNRHNMDFHSTEGFSRAAKGLMDVETDDEFRMSFSQKKVQKKDVDKHILPPQRARRPRRRAQMQCLPHELKRDFHCTRCSRNFQHCIAQLG